MPTDTAPQAWTTRDFRPADTPALSQLWQGLGGAATTFDAADFERRLRDAWVRVACLESGEILGFAAIRVPGHIEWLATAPDWQGQGIASALLEDLDFLAGAMGARHISADVPATAEAFFSHRGFGGQGRMEKRLA